MMGEHDRDNFAEKDQLRRYVLGRVPDEAERDSIEERLMTDDRYFEELRFVEEELIDEFLEEGLSPADSAHFETQIKLSPELDEKVRFARAFRQNIAERSAMPEMRSAAPSESLLARLLGRFRSPVPAFALSAVLLSLVALGIWYSQRSDVSAGLASLNRAYRMNRPIQSRLEEIDHAPFSNTRGGPNESIDLNERNRGELLLLNEVARSRTADSLSALGKAYLLKGSFEEAVAQFESAEQLEPANAEVKSDLGAAILERSRTLRSEEAMLARARALEKFETAIELDPGNLAAYFNRALCLESLSLNLQAKQAWEEYLRRDGASPWADEARRHLDALRTTSQTPPPASAIDAFVAACDRSDDTLAHSIQGRNREMITGRLIPQQLALRIPGAVDGDRRLYIAALSCAGRLDKNSSGDPFFSELATYYSSRSESAGRLADAHSAISSGYELSLRTDFSSARTQFATARKLYENEGDRWEALLCDYWIAYADYQIGRIDESSARLSQVAALSKAGGYHWLRAQAVYWLSVNSRTRNEHSQALRFADEALADAVRSGDNYSIQKAYSWRADTRMRVRQTSGSAADLHAAIELGSTGDSSPRQRWRDLDVGSQLFQAIKQHHAAAAFAAEALQLNSESINDLSYERVTSARLARILGSLKRFDPALELTERSKRAAANIPDPGNSRKGVAFAFFQQGALDRERGDCGSAIAAYNSAIEIYDSTEIGQYHYEARKGRLLCRLADNDTASFEKELPEVLRLFEDNRRRIVEEANRNSFFNDEQSVYDVAIGHEFARGNVETAFDYSERSRSRSLLDLISGEPADEVAAATRPAGLIELRSRIPEAAQIVEYAVLPERLIIWIVSAKQFDAVSVDVPAGKLRGDVDDFLKAISPGSDPSPAAREVYRSLIRPIESRLDPAADIFVVPDKFLFRIPFAALADDAGAHLVERFRISVTPSANVFVIASDNARRRAADEERILSIGDPAFDRTEFPGLGPLPAAVSEARDIGGLYDEHIVLTGAAATKNSILGATSAADIIHVAAHYEVDPSATSNSAFALAGSGPASRLENRELLDRRFAHIKLVVLSACDTAVETYFDGEGMIGAGRTLLAAGVPLVVVSQWKVDSDAAAMLMKSFHRHRRTERLPSSEALRRAQLEMLGSGDPHFRSPASWAAFVPIGGYAEF